MGIIGSIRGVLDGLAPEPLGKKIDCSHPHILGRRCDKCHGIIRSNTPLKKEYQVECMNCGGCGNFGTPDTLHVGTRFSDLECIECGLMMLKVVRVLKLSEYQYTPKGALGC